MIINLNDSFQDHYVSPIIEVLEIKNEGLLCISGNGSNDPFYEDDEWSNLFD